MKRYIASDFHNGNDVADYDKVMSFLDLVDADADEFLILGDLLELLWSNLNILTTVSPYRDVIYKIKSIASKKPTKLILGNHSWNLGLFSSYIQPVEIVPPFSEDGIYFCHGAEFDWLSLWTSTPVDPIYWSIAFPFVLPLGFPLWLATKVWLGDKDKYDWGIEIINFFAAKYARGHGYHSVVLGHTHYPQDILEDGIRIVNTGDLLDSYSFSVQTEGGIELRYYSG